MFRTVALVFALVGSVGAFGYAQNLRGYQALNFKNPRTLGGQVNSNGSVARGAHFTVTHLATGEYEVDFDVGYFPNGCPIPTVTSLGYNIIGYAIMRTCRTYDVYLANITNGHASDTAFDLIAVASE